MEYLVLSSEVNKRDEHAVYSSSSLEDCIRFCNQLDYPAYVRGDSEDDDVLNDILHTNKEWDQAYAGGF